MKYFRDIGPVVYYDACKLLLVIGKKCSSD